VFSKGKWAGIPALFLDITLDLLVYLGYASLCGGWFFQEVEMVVFGVVMVVFAVVVMAGMSASESVAS
jgi:hypothetical protein